MILALALAWLPLVQAPQSTDLKLDWFRRGTGEFEVVMTYADRDDFDSSARLLRSAGFRVD